MMYSKKIVFLLVCCVGISMNQIAFAESGSNISIDFTEIKTRNLLKILAKNADRNLVISEKIDGKITISLKNVSWRKAFDTVLRMKGLIKHEVNNVTIVLTPGEIEKNRQSILKTQAFNLQHVSAKSVVELLKPAGVLSEYGKMGADAKSNSLVVVDAGSNIKVVKDLIREIDIPAKQVLIEARIVSADKTFLRELGLELSSHSTIATNGLKNKSRAINLNHGQFNFAIAKMVMGNNILLDLQLAALENEGRGRVISKPKLLTTDREAAYIEAGAEIPYQEKTKEGNTSTVFKKAVLSLKVTPEVVAKDGIRLSIELSQDKVGQLVINGVPTIDTRKIHTKVLASNNETVVLGGIYEWTKSSYVAGLPFLGQIPLLNVFFSKKKTRAERRELLIFVTPRLK